MAPVYPPRGTSPWDHPLRQYIDKSVDEVRGAVRSILGALSGVKNPAALAPYHAVDPALETRRIVAVGDSITEGGVASSYTNAYPLLLQSALRTELGHGGGVGYVAATSAPGAVVPPLPLTSQATLHPWQFGLGGRAVQLKDPGDHVTYTTQPCTQIKVYYSKVTIAGGGLKVEIDGVDQGVTLSSQAAGASGSGGHVWTSPPLAAGNHVVKITPSNTPFVGVLEGVEFINGDENSGVRVYNAGHYGGSAHQFAASQMDPMWETVAAIDPHLVTIMLGANDLLTSNPATYLTSIDTMISKVPAGVPILLIGCYLLGMYGDDPAKIAEWEQMQAGLAARASGRVAYLDLAPHWPNLLPDGSTNDGLMFESTNASHPNDAGMSKIASVLAEALSPSVLAGIVSPSGGSGSVDVSGKLDKTATLSTAPTAPLFKRVLNYVMSTGHPNLVEFNVNGVLRSWINEWGGLRGRVPYSNYNDALVRAIVEPGDTIQTSGNAFEVVDRRKPAGDGRQSWGVRWSDGRTVQNGIPMTPVYYHENAGAPLPTDLPVPCLVLYEV